MVLLPHWQTVRLPWEGQQIVHRGTVNRDHTLHARYQCRSRDRQRSFSILRMARALVIAQVPGRARDVTAVMTRCDREQTQTLYRHAVDPIQSTLTVVQGVEMAVTMM